MTDAINSCQKLIQLINYKKNGMDGPKNISEAYADNLTKKR